MVHDGKFLHSRQGAWPRLSSSPTDARNPRMALNHTGRNPGVTGTLFPEHFRDDENDERAKKAAAKKHVDEGVSDCGNRRHGQEK